MRHETCSGGDINFTLSGRWASTVIEQISTGSCQARSCTTSGRWIVCQCCSQPWIVRKCTFSNDRSLAPSFVFLQLYKLQWPQCLISPISPFLYTKVNVAVNIVTQVVQRSVVGLFFVNYVLDFKGFIMKKALIIIMQPTLSYKNTSKILKTESSF